MKIISLSAIAISFASVACGATSQPTSAELKSESAQEQIVFDASVCTQRIPGGYRRNCSATAATIETDRPSASEDRFLKELLYENSLSYIFNCQSSAPLDARIGLDNRWIPLAQSADSNPVVLPGFAVSYSGSSYRIEIKPKSHVAIAPDCKLALLANVTLPPAAALDIYATMLAESFEKWDQLLEQVRNAADLPAKWSVVQDLPRQLVQRANNHKIDCRRMVRELDSFLNITPKERNQQQLARIADLVGEEYATRSMMIDSEVICLPHSMGDLNIKNSAFCNAMTHQDDVVFGGILGKTIDESRNLLCLARDVAEGLPRVSACSGDGTGVCLAEVNAVEAKLVGLRAAGGERLESLRRFLNSEISRLHHRYEQVERNLNWILAGMPAVN